MYISHFGNNPSLDNFFRNFEEILNNMKILKSSSKHLEFTICVDSSVLRKLQGEIYTSDLIFGQQNQCRELFPVVSEW